MIRISILLFTAVLCTGCNYWGWSPPALNGSFEGMLIPAKIKEDNGKEWNGVAIHLSDRQVKKYLSEKDINEQGMTREEHLFLTPANSPSIFVLVRRTKQAKKYSEGVPVISEDIQNAYGKHAIVTGRLGPGHWENVKAIQIIGVDGRIISENTSDPVIQELRVRDNSKIKIKSSEGKISLFKQEENRY